MPNVKLLICYHKPATLFKDEIFTPIHVGRANARKKATPGDKNYQWMLDNMIGDDTGENISDRNGCYNEMTSLYWAWKNYDKLGNPDYIGLMHYRRHFVFREDEKIVYNIENFDEESYLREINYSPEKVYNMLEGCDFITHIGKVINVYNHYIENHRQEDLDLAVDIMLEKYPEYKEITKEYFAGDYSNFCNMFIMNKKLFFQYCEWIFDILEEFENRVDVSEKRFFISERLTGIFIAKLMADKSLKYKVLPISFIEDPVKIPIAMPVSNNRLFQVATTITSILEAAKGYNQFQFYLLNDGQLQEHEKQKFDKFEENYPWCKIEFVDTDVKEEYYPLYVSKALKGVNKCIYMSGNIIALQDLGEFYRICSTDDYYVVGTALEKYDVKTPHKELSPYILVLNCGRLRQHKMWEKSENDIKAGKNGMEIFNQFCENQIGYIPWYFVTRDREREAKDFILQATQTRGDVQLQATWRALLIYDEIEPWIDSQGVYSIFWWDNAVKVPPVFGFMAPNSRAIKVLYTKQQKEINEWGVRNWEPPYEAEVVQQSVQEHPPVEVQTPVEVESLETEKNTSTGNEEWRTYSLLGKLRFFYQHNGLKKTITYSCGKVIKGITGKGSK
ncbi:DUF4422 domain-containing protein [Blautia sp.]|uniref:DUF4422 domain-containing protein n=1 Tax=Blautia sp. TaxID=1955243 RepID=UPI0025BACF55|nr:DUF4422 domain-containing protein [Blautia sp.]